MAKNIVICCDGTGNEIEANLSNVLKLFRVLQKDKPEEQVVFYDPGIGTLGSADAWSRLKNNTNMVFGQATGYGLDTNVLTPYRFLVEAYERGDHVYLFGFSRGAYTVRVLAGLLRLVGLLDKPQSNLARYALTAYKMAAAESDFTIAWRFERVAVTRRIPIKFIGVWDTVSSIIVPRRDRFYIPSLQQLPYTRENSFVEIFRQAMAIDERRRMFRLNRWTDAQVYQPNPFSKAEPVPQDVRQVWFCGCHSDVGGGYPEVESGIAKFPLKWMIGEAVRHGVKIKTAMYRHLVLGQRREDGSRQYVPPDVKAPTHNSMTLGWMGAEVLPKRVKWREWAKRPSALGLYLPLGEPRLIAEGAVVHHSVFERMDRVKGYSPANVPPSDRIEIEEDRDL